MKKYVVVSFVFFLSFILLGFNVKSTSAFGPHNDYTPGCGSTEGYSPTTGAKCAILVYASLPPGCTGNSNYSTTTGQPCGATITTPSVAVFTRNLSAKLKSRGDDVLALQQFLKDAGYLFGKVDGKFGKITGRAVGDFQEDNDLTRTEIVDAATRMALNTTSMPNPPEYYNPMSPVISEVIGPESLNVNQTGTWTVKASSISGGNLSYSVNWGDEYLYAANTNAANQMSASQQSATFTHSYSQAGTYKPVFMASNSATSTQKQVSVVVGIESSQLLVITTTSLSRGAVALSYFANISATGGTGEYNWSLSSGSLPVGLSLLKSQCLSYPCKEPAVIDGIPIKAGTYNFTIKVISGLQYYTKNFTLTVNPVDIFPVSPVISGVSGPQTLNINQTGTWSVKASSSNGGNLSYGVVWGDEIYASLLLDPNSGKSPIMQQSATFTHSYSQTGTYTPTFTVTNSNEQSVKTSLSVKIGETTTNSAPKISSILPPGCTSPEGYSSYNGESCSSVRIGDFVYINGSNFNSNATVWLDGGSYSSVDGSRLTFPVSFVSSGRLTFTVPASAGLGNHKIQVNIQAGQTLLLSNVVSLKFLSSATSSLSITTISPLPNAKVEQLYSTNLIATGGTGLYGWDTGSVSGIPVPGLRLEICTGSDDSCIDGTPTTAGVYTFNLTATSGSQSVSKQFTLTVDSSTAAIFYIGTSSPLPVAKAGNLYGIPVDTFGGDNTLPFTWSGTSGSLPPGLAFVQSPTWTSARGSIGEMGSTRGYITGTPTASGTYTFTLQFAQGSLVANKQFTLTVDPTTQISNVLVFSITPLVTYRGETTITINGSNLTNQVSFYDANGARTTVVGTVNSSATQTTVLVPAELPTGTSLVKIYQGSQIWSNGILIGVNSRNVLGAESFHFTRFLGEGSRGNEVIELEKFLNKAGYDIGNIDGIFGPKIKAALIKFQIANNLKSDGIVGFEVRSLLNK